MSVYSAVKYGGFTLVLNVFPFSCKGYSSIVLKFILFIYLPPSHVYSRLLYSAAVVITVFIPCMYRSCWVF